VNQWTEQKTQLIRPIRLSGSIGIAVISSFFFSFINTKGIVSSMQTNLLIIAVALLVCVPIVGLLPKNKGEQEEH